MGYLLAHFSVVLVQPIDHVPKVLRHFLPKYWELQIFKKLPCGCLKWANTKFTSQCPKWGGGGSRPLLDNVKKTCFSSSKAFPKEQWGLRTKWGLRSSGEYLQKFSGNSFFCGSYFFVLPIFFPDKSRHTMQTTIIAWLLNASFTMACNPKTSGMIFYIIFIWRPAFCRSDERRNNQLWTRRPLRIGGIWLLAVSEGLPPSPLCKPLFCVRFTCPPFIWLVERLLWWY